jgi:hypothetical protein
MTCTEQGVWLEGVVPIDGWWRPSNRSLQFLPCLYFGNCVKGVCAQNREGTLCALCKDGYTAASQSADCTLCPNRVNSIAGTAGFTVLLIFALGVVLYAVWRSDSLPVVPIHVNAHEVIKGYMPEHKARPNITYNFKILVSYFQIITSLFNFVDIPWPTAFQEFIGYFSFVNFDFIPYVRSRPLQAPH